MRIKRHLRLFLALALTAPAAALAQDEAIRVETELVSVNVAVADAKGNPVRNLKGEQFEIYDDGTKRQISHFSAAEAPVTYGIVYDLHPTTPERTAAVLDSLRAFAKTLGESDRFFLTAFNHRGSLTVDFIPTAEQLEKNLAGAGGGSRSGEPTSLYDAIYAAAEKIRESRSPKRAILVISDSADHRSRHSFSELSRQLRGLDAQVYAVIFDESEMWSFSDLTREGGEKRRRALASGDASKLDRVALEELTIKSGGTSHFPTAQTSQELSGIYVRIAAEMRDSYTLSFYPAGKDGKWHELKIRLRGVRDGGRLAMTYRRGYQSSK